MSLVVAIVASLLVLGPAAPASAAWSTPSLVRSIGGNGRPGVFAWGLQYNPVSHEVLVGDYLNFQIRRYDSSGNFLGEFFRADNVGQPYSIAVDPHDGSIYVAELKDNPFIHRIVKYDRFGNYLFDFAPANVSGRAEYSVWLTVDDQGFLWALDSHYWNTVSSPPLVAKYDVDDVTRTASVVKSFPVLPAGTTDDTVPRMYGIDVSSSGIVYLSDAKNGVAYKIDGATGQILSTFGGAFLGQDNRGVVFDDDTGRLYIVDAGHSDVDVFDANGTHLSAFGSEGTGNGQFSGGGRQIDVDGAGNVWVSDFGNFRAQKFTPSGTFLLAAPSPPRPPAAGFFAEPRDVDVDDRNGDVWVADSWNQRFQRFSSGGAFIGTWGRRNLDPPFGMNYPRGIGVDEARNRLWVAQERGHHYKVYSITASNPTYVANVGAEQVDSTDPGYLRWPNDVEFYGSKAFISDRTSGLVKIFDAGTYTELQQFSQTNTGGLAVDPATGRLYVGRTPNTSTTNKRGAVYRYVPDVNGAYALDTTFGVGVTGGCSIAPCGYVGYPSGTGNGQFTDPRDMIVINNVLYVSDEGQSRITALDMTGNFLGRWGGYGTGPYQFRNPSGLARDPQGRLYVADAGNDRIQVFDTNVARPASESVLPTVTVTAPVNNSVQPAGTVRFSGTAADDQILAQVEISIQDVASGKWWNPTNEAWQDTEDTALAAYTGTATSRSWSWWFNGVVPGRTYRAEIAPRDGSGNTAPAPIVRTFSMAGGLPPPDTAAPDTSITVPAIGQEFAPGTVAMSGTVADNVGVASAQVSIQNTGDGSWWNGSTWVSSQTWLAAVIASPGAKTTSWSFSWASVPAGSYAVSARASDAVPNVETSPAVASFSVIGSQPDTIAPDTQITFPSNNQAVALGAITFAGTATDNRGVSSVQVAIRNRTTGLWWNGSSWVTFFTWLNGAVLGTPGGGSTGWTFAWSPPARALYSVTARARDAAGNVDSVRPWINFQVV